jgi:hypothetical protein
VIEKAVVTAAGHHAPPADDGAFPVQAHSTALLRGPMAWDTVLAEDRRYIPAEIDLGGFLR